MVDFGSKLEYIIIDKERSITPNSAYTVLKEAVLNYYNTFESLNEIRGLSYVHKIKNVWELNVVTKHDFLINYIESIILIQSFFEYYISSKLYEVSPNLVSGNLHRDIDFVDVITGNWKNIKEKDKTLNFGVQLKRLMTLLENIESLPQEFQKLKSSVFILKHKHALKELSKQRNNIIHKGDMILPIYYYELLMVKYVFPLIKDILRLDTNSQKIEYPNYSKINIINEIVNIELRDEFNNKDGLSKKTIQSLKHLNHLKALGRASMKNKLDMIYGRTNFSIEKHRNIPIRLEAEKMVYYKKLINNGKIQSIYTCPACGVKSLFTCEVFESYHYTIPPLNFLYTMIGPSKATCYQCSYSNNSDNGEPKDYGLKCDYLFNTKFGQWGGRRDEDFNQ